MSNKGNIKGTCTNPECGKEFNIAADLANGILAVFASVECPHCGDVVDSTVGTMSYIGANTWE